MKKRTILLTFLLSFVCTSLFSGPKVPADEYNCPQIRPNHPRIFFNSETWPTIKARAEGPAKEYLDKLIHACNKMTDNPVCENTGPVVRKIGKQADGTFISATGSSIKPIKEFGKEAAMCALAWRFTGDDKYLEKARRMLKASVDGYTEATNNKRPVDWYAFNRINALCAYDWIYEGLTQEQRREIIVPLVEHCRIVQPEAGAGIPRQPAGSKTTGFYGMNSLLWYSGLAAYGDGFCDSLAQAHLKKGYKLHMEIIDYRNETAGDDGALISPALNYALGMYPFSHFNFFSSFYSATGRNIADRYPNMALFPYWVWWTWIRDTETPKQIRCAGPADFYHATNAMEAEYMFEHLSNYLAFFENSNPEAYAFTAAFREWSPKKNISNKFPLTPFLIDLECDVDPNIADKLEKPNIKARHFETLGQIIMRSGWTPDATYCTFTTGAKVTGHKHYDENNFTIFKYDHLALDTGDRGQQNDLNLAYYYAQSVAHNVILIQKPEEPLPIYWGPKTDEKEANWNYGGQVNKTPSDIKAFETNDTYTYVASDATASYGSKAKECVRQFVYVYPDYFIVYDRVESSDPSYEKDWLLHFKNEPVVKGNVLRADSESGRLFCQTFLPADSKIDVIGGPGKEFWVRDRNFEIAPKSVAANLRKANKFGHGPYTGAWRIELKPNKAAASDRFLNVISVGSTTMMKPVSAKYVKNDTQDGVTLTIKGKKITVMFNRSGEVGGTISVGKKETVLATSVQPQSGPIL